MEDIFSDLKWQLYTHLIQELNKFILVSLSLREDFLIYAFYFYINQGVYIMQKNVVGGGGAKLPLRKKLKMKIWGEKRYKGKGIREKTEKNGGKDHKNVFCHNFISRGKNNP